MTMRGRNPRPLNLSDGLNLDRSVGSTGELARLDTGSGGLGALWQELEQSADEAAARQEQLTATKASFMVPISSMSFK